MPTTLSVYTGTPKNNTLLTVHFRDGIEIINNNLIAKRAFTFSQPFTLSDDDQLHVIINMTKQFFHYFNAYWLSVTTYGEEATKIIIGQAIPENIRKMVEIVESGAPFDGKRNLVVVSAVSRIIETLPFHLLQHIPEKLVKETVPPSIFDLYAEKKRKYSEVMVTGRR